MTAVDFVIFGLYMVGVIAVGYYFYRRNRTIEDYYVGGRNVSAHHVGLSVVATDVGGGFSIGLGGVGFAMGIAGSWLLFTGLVGAWLSAVFIIPRIKRVDRRLGMLTYPDFLRHAYNDRVALLAALISGIGYLGFTGGQVLAGAKLAAGTLFAEHSLGMNPLHLALVVIGTVIVVYTVLGGLKAVIYTDTVQWIILLVGLSFFAIPFALREVGGLAAMRESLPREHFSLFAISPIQFINWMVTIVPIWLVAMTLYQRVYACRDVKEARKAWYIAGIFEYPVMAFMGVFLGMCARVLFPEADKEMALPCLSRPCFPWGSPALWWRPISRPSCPRPTVVSWPRRATSSTICSNAQCSRTCRTEAPFEYPRSPPRSLASSPSLWRLSQQRCSTPSCTHMHFW